MPRSNSRSPLPSGDDRWQRVFHLLRELAGTVDGVASPEPDVLKLVESAYHQHFETEPVRASVSFVGVEPIEILLYGEVDPAKGATSYLLSLGMSRRPMTPADEVLRAGEGPRAELMLATRAPVEQVWRRVAVLAAGPDVEGIVYEAGMRIELGESWFPGSRCVGAVLIEAALVPIRVDPGQPVRVLEIKPATAEELAWARVHGTQRLVDRWAEAGTDLTDLLRPGVPLD